MKIFLSYPSEERDVAERTNYALLALGHDVFLDRDDLGAGQEYNQRIAGEIEGSDLFVFFISPASVAHGRYTLTELELAERKWPHAAGRVLPVMLRATPVEAVPAYLRAVSFLVPRGDPAAETAQEAHRLAKSLPLWVRIARHSRGRRVTIGLGVAAVVLAGTWGGVSWHRAHDFFGPGSDSVTTAAYFPKSIRGRARAVAAMADGGFMVATVSPPQLLRFSRKGDRVGEPIALRGEPVRIERTPSQIMVITRAPSEIIVLNWTNLLATDTLSPDTATIAPPHTGAVPPRLSREIRSAAVFKGTVFVVTGEKDGEPAVLRFDIDRKWKVPSWTPKEDGIIGPDARGMILRRIDQDLWGVNSHTRPSSVYHMEQFNRVDVFRGENMAMVACATDMAANAAKQAVFLTCDNRLQAVEPRGNSILAMGSLPTLPRDSGPDTWTSESIVPEGTAMLVALNTEVGTPQNRPARARIAEVDSARGVETLFDKRSVVVHAMAATPRLVIAVLRLADGRFDAVVVPRRPPD